MTIPRVKYPIVGFRVEALDRNNQRINGRFSHGNLIPRGCNRELDYEAFRDHLTIGCKRGGPLISFYRSWNSAMKQRKTFIEKEKAPHVVIYAVWLEGLELYDAYDVAKQVGIDDLRVYVDEVLLRGCISDDTYRILATFHGCGTPEDVVMTLPKLLFRLQVPPDPYITRNGISTWLQAQICMHTGVQNDPKFYHLALAMGNQSYTVNEKGTFILGSL